MWGIVNLRFRVFTLLLSMSAIAVGGCASVYNLPANRPLLSPVPVQDVGRMDPSFDDDVLLMLSFSGGGTRAAAFSFGVLQELDHARSGSKSAKSLLDRVDYVSGVSGGSITAAYFGLKQRAALADFRERFLLRNAEENLKTAVTLANIGRALNGGANDNQLPDWIERARHNPDAQPLLRSFAESTARYHDGSMKYVKLLDGGLVDNFGLSGFSIGILAAQRGHDPMTEKQAVRVRRILFLVVDAGRGLSGNWANSLDGPSGTELVAAAADTAIDASVRLSYAAFSTLLAEWSAKVRRWRCALSPADRARLGVPAGWKCDDLNTFIERLSFERLGSDRAAALEAVATRLTLPADQVDLLIEGGALALRNSKTYQAFRSGI